MKAVFIGDDAEVANFITTSMRLRWPDLTLLVATTATIGLEMVEEQLPDVLLLHASTTDKVLAQAVQELRQVSAVPLLVIGARADPLQVVTALDLGADDYVRLPCPLAELTARVWALLRRTEVLRIDDGDIPLAKGALLINPATYEVFLGERRLPLSVTDFRLLRGVISTRLRWVMSWMMSRIKFLPTSPR